MPLFSRFQSKQSSPPPSPAPDSYRSLSSSSPSSSSVRAKGHRDNEPVSPYSSAAAIYARDLKDSDSDIFLPSEPSQFHISTLSARSKRASSNQTSSFFKQSVPRKLDASGNVRSDSLETSSGSAKPAPFRSAPTLVERKKSSSSRARRETVPSPSQPQSPLRRETQTSSSSSNPSSEDDLSPQEEKFSEQPQKPAKWSWFSSNSKSETSPSKATVKQVISSSGNTVSPPRAPLLRSQSSIAHNVNGYRKDSTSSESSFDSSTSDDVSTVSTITDMSSRKTIKRTNSSRDGYFAQGNGSYSDSPTSFEQFPASVEPPYSPPDSEDYITPEEKPSWFSGFFSRKQQQEEQIRSEKDQVFRNGPPSPPTSVLSTASTTTVRQNVNMYNTNRSTTSLSTMSSANMYASGRSRNNNNGLSSPTSLSPSYGTASTSPPEQSSVSGGSTNTWAFWSRQSKNDKVNTISEDGVVAFSGPSAQSFIRNQRGKPVVADNASVMTADTTIQVSRKNTLSRNSSKSSLGTNTSAYPPNSYGSATSLPGYDSPSVYSNSRLNRSESYKVKMEDSRSVRTIETIGKPNRNTVKSASGAKETALMAPQPTNTRDPNMMKADGFTQQQEKPEKPEKPEKLEKSDKEKRKSKKKAKEERMRYPNMVVPKLNDCLSVAQPPSALWSSFNQAVSRFFESTEKKPNPGDPLRVELTTPPRIRKAVAIGIHGFFPIRMVRSIIGEPTGTSVKFANEAAMAIQRWAEAHGQSDMEIEKIALEGEGIVLDRVENLYRLLSNWMDHLLEADFILVAAHSQGTPVAVQLVAKLIGEGYADNKKIGILGMAGVSLGPFYGLDQKIVMRAYSSFESDSLKELFSFQNPESLPARRYMEGLRTVIAHGVKVTYIGSVNDPLVPLYSALCVHVTHPHIYRAIYVDGKAVAPSFIIYLIELLTKLRNYGYTDHGIIRDISDALAGTFTGGGHSTIYNEYAVYDMAIKNTLETSEIPDIPVHIDEKFEVPMPSNFNPYHLPWSVRGMLENSFVQENLREDVDKVLDHFDYWEPESKPLKDIKYRLSAIKRSATSDGKLGSIPPLPPAVST
ncbi:uncharacterized protein V1516DRAFT_677281 [Lipomyces oligophaga]|uniref:uncharacterized protein n=1 Tax=Lipomyces oligophaga TaxID=45792 RepID=UPI0034CF5320